MMTLTVPIRTDRREPDLSENVSYTGAVYNDEDGTVTVTLTPDSAREWRMKEMEEAAEQDRADLTEFLERVGNAQPNAVRDIAKEMADKRKGRKNQ